MGVAPYSSNKEDEVDGETPGASVLLAVPLTYDLQVLGEDYWTSFESIKSLHRAPGYTLRRRRLYYYSSPNLPTMILINQQWNPQFPSPISSSSCSSSYSSHITHSQKPPSSSHSMSTPSPTPENQSTPLSQSVHPSPSTSSSTRLTAPAHPPPLNLGTAADVVLEVGGGAGSVRGRLSLVLMGVCGLAVVMVSA